MNILTAIAWFALLGGVFGLLLALASKLFNVKVDEKCENIIKLLPGVNCGGCGYSGCAALAKAISDGNAAPAACTAAKKDAINEIGAVMGVDIDDHKRMRAQVMCSGTIDYAKKKYIYEGVQDCVSAVRFGGGDKICANGCIGIGTCAEKCMFDAIIVVNGVAAIDYQKCTGCGTCVSACPKGIIELIPYDSAHWVGCKTVENGEATRKFCEVGCISCGLCAKICESNAIKSENSVAVIEYDKCTGCDKCVEKCPRNIIWSGSTHSGLRAVITIPKEEIDENA